MAIFNPIAFIYYRGYYVPIDFRSPTYQWILLLDHEYIRIENIEITIE